MVRQYSPNPSTNQPPPNDYTERIKDTYGKVKEGLSHIGKDFPHGMEPRGNGWYSTPDVISPNDCDNYPESIYCGGNPVSKPKSPVGFDFDWGINNCGAFASVKTEIAGFSLPTHSLAWVKDECRQDYERDERDRKNPPPPPPGDYSKHRPEVSPGYRPSGFNLSDEVIVITVDSEYDEQQYYLRHIDAWAASISYVEGVFKEVKYPTDTLVPSYRYPSSMLTADITAEGTFHSQGFANSVWQWDILYSNGSYDPDNPPDPFFTSSNEDFLLGMPPDQGYNFDYCNGAQLKYFTKTLLGNVFPVAVWRGRLGAIFPYYQISPIQYRSGEGIDALGRPSKSFYAHQRKIVYIARVDGTSEPRRPHYDNPPPPDKDCCMQCCSQQNNNRDDDLAKILKELRDIKKVVGFEEFPVKVPESLIDKDEGFIGNLIPNAPVQEPNIPRLLGRFIRYFDEIMGQWEIPIEIKDSDPNTPGDQPKGIRLKNMAESIADIYGLLFDNYITSQQLLQTTTKTLIETGLTKQNAIQNYFAIMCLVDFFGFKYKEITQNVPFSFTVGEEEFEKFIESSEKEIKVLDVDVNDKNVVTYKDDMLVLKHAASIIKAVHFRKLDHKGDMKQQLLDLVKLAAQYSGKVTNGEIKPDGHKSDEFARWCEDAETEFSRQTGINTENPYGRPYEQRPRITILNPDGGTANPPSTGG